MSRHATVPFGDVALALEPRAECPPLGRPSPEDARARLFFRRAGLSAEARARLLRAGSATLTEVSERTSRLTANADELEALGREDAAALALSVAWKNACAPPGLPRLMGVLNATPDSFSDGGRFLDPSAALERARTLLAEGADILDVGGESSRPGAQPVSIEEELARVLPVIEAVREETDAPISIDTVKAPVAAAALDAGASAVNDISAGRFDPDMLALVAERGCDYYAMHMRGSPRDMQVDPTYEDPVREVTEHLRERVAAGLKAGIDVSRIAVDPGIGFGKELEHNLALLRHLPDLRSLGRPLMVGVSRKSFLGRLTGVQEPAAREAGSAGAVAAAVVAGAEILRVHDVAAMRDVARVVTAILGRSAATDHPMARRPREGEGIPS